MGSPPWNHSLIVFGFFTITCTCINVCEKVPKKEKCSEFSLRHYAHLLLGMVKQKKRTCLHFSVKIYMIHLNMLCIYKEINIYQAYYLTSFTIFLSDYCKLQFSRTVATGKVLLWYDTTPIKLLFAE